MVRTAIIELTATQLKAEVKRELNCVLASEFSVHEAEQLSQRVHLQ